jgi:hypothetical protein
MTFAIAPTRVRIAAPDALAALDLEQRLAHMEAVALGTRAGWHVELEDDEDRSEEIEATIRHWLRDTGRWATLLTVDHSTRWVRLEHERCVQPDCEPLGAGYDELVLTHEP